MAVKHGYEPPSALAMGVAVAKVHGLAVAETARWQGLAAVLLKRARQVHDQLGYLLMYGSYETERNPATFYTGWRYTVLDAGQGVSLQRIGIPFGVHADPHECVFTSWRSPPRRCAHRGGPAASFPWSQSC
ncbi:MULTISPECIES: hypothetical protein [Streptomyces]|uniref:GNAT superfamily N-acetyltransferase n=1 Tax=Streptomyces demainii TaxID=588122 RepID=A0ABT9KHF5_9ACTN|nr:hypothetical protein [Streptomyces demainii]MDP9607853.1 GNAT superfamily N-acetyltransferase [Streptomyces demainii]